MSDVFETKPVRPGH